MRAEFADYCSRLLRRTPNRHVVFLGDISVGLFLSAPEGELIDGVFNLGILEQSMMSFAAGFSRGGGLPIVHSISPFIVERAYEQLKLDLCYNQTKVIVVSANGPFDYSKLGPTHHCSADIPLIDLLPRMSWAAPGRREDVSAAMDWAISQNESVYIRLTNRSSTSDVKPGRLIAAKSVEDSEKGEKKLTILVGEALSKFSDVLSDQTTLDSDFLYIWAAEQIPLDVLGTYQHVDLWEPYSRSVLADRIREVVPNPSQLLSYTYPDSMEDGIFEDVQFTRRPVFSN